MKQSRQHQSHSGFIFLMIMFISGVLWAGFIPEASAATHFQVAWAEWKAGDRKLKLKGYGAGRKNIVAVKNVATGETLGTTRSEDDGKFEFSKEHLASVPGSLLVTTGTRSVAIGFTKATRQRGGPAVLIRTAEWSSSEQTLWVNGTAPSEAEVVFFGVENGMASTKAASDGRWRKKFIAPSPVPCRIRIQTDGAAAEMAVENAPLTCGVATPPEDPLLTGISISGPSEVAEKTRAIYTAVAAYGDGTTRDVTEISLWQADDADHAQMSGGGLTTLDVPADLVIVLTATYAENGVSRSNTLRVTILDQAISLEGSHANRFASYEGTSTCLACHTPEAMAVHGSVHYQWKGSTSETVGLNPGDAGKQGGINDFCIYPDINWIGKLTNISGQPVDGGCAKCHVGLGRKPEAEASVSQLENIDCLVCHSENYKRKVEMVDGAYRFVPDTEKNDCGNATGGSGHHASVQRPLP